MHQYEVNAEKCPHLLFGQLISCGDTGKYPHDIESCIKGKESHGLLSAALPGRCATGPDRRPPDTHAMPDKRNTDETISEVLHIS